MSILAWPCSWLLLMPDPGASAETCSYVQGDATAALAAIASRNRAHLPEAPLADASATVAAQRGLADVLSSARLRRRFALIMAMWCCAYLVCSVDLQML